MLSSTRVPFSSKAKSYVLTLNLSVAWFPLSTFPVASSETFKVTTFVPNVALGATLPVIVAVAGFVSEPLFFERVFPLFITVFPSFKVTPAGNPLICLILIFPCTLLSCIFNGIFKVAPLNTSTSGAPFSESPSVESVLFGFVILTVGATESVTLNLTGMVLATGV